MEPADFKNYYRIESESYQELLDLVTPYIEKKSTNMRDAIPAHERPLSAFRHPSKIGAPEISTTWVS
nr:unnamed protein product [Callosobruchus chinensis]